MKKTIVRKFMTGFLLAAGFTLAAGLNFAILSCANITTSASDYDSVSPLEYGSITLSSGDDSSRALDVSNLTSATVTVSGYGMKEIEVKDVTISEGFGNCRVEKVPVGANRVITVKSNVDGGVIRAVSDIKTGNNNVKVNWKTTAAANVFYYLIKDGCDVSSLKTDSFASKIPEVHASLFDAEKFAAALKAANLNADSLTAGDYILDYGRVKVTSKNAGGYTVQVTDVASEKKTLAGDSDSFELKAYPGSWKARVYDAGGSLVCEKDITVVAGEESTLDVTYSDGTGYDFTGKTIIFVKADSAPDIWAWEDGSGVELSKASGGSWGTSSAATKLTAVSSEYMASGDGWYMIDYSEKASGKTIKFKLNWSNPEITGKAGTFWYDGSSVSSENPSPVTGGEGTIILTVNSATPPAEPVKIYVSSISVAPKIWVWQPDGSESTTLMGYTWEAQPVMTAATGLNYNSGWYVLSIPGDCYTEGKAFDFILNSGSKVTTTKTSTFWYDAAGVSGDAGTYYNSDPTTIPEPVEPSLSISPDSGKEIGTSSSIKILASFGNETPSVKSLTINGKSYTLNEGSNVYPVSDITTEAGVKITVSATLTNSKGSAALTASYTTKVSKEDPFTWDNVNCYFVLTDRFANGDKNNDHSYYRQNKDNNSLLASGYNNVATFHGGDIKGLTEKLDYLNKLGVNAIWITAPYEQAHGWCQGGGNGFPHYAFHGYYTQDWTYMDQNMGTIDEFRTFVNEAHKRGIRVVMDVVLNHTGYNTVEDMITYSFGKYDAVTMNHGWCANAGGWNANPNGGKDGKSVDGYKFDSDYWKNENWDNTWWGCWIRSFGFSQYATGGDICSSLAGLPDVRTELTDKVSIPAFLKKKWTDETDSKLIPSESGNTTGNKYGDYKLPTVGKVDWYGKSGDWRADNKGGPTDYQIIWLSGWVREFGIDGFRCDTAKHVHMNRWGQLKDACQSALEAWRGDSSKEDTAGAKEWDENFWMTGECFDWKSIAGQGDYYTTGKFDSMIEFSVGGGNKWEESSYAYHSPSINEAKWGSYLSINSNADSDSNGNRNNVLTYISSHDTRLGRWSNQDELGTMFELLPGGIQIYYGDETSREKAYTDCGDGDMATRGDFDWSKAEGTCAAHWGKVGNFRKYNPAVGAGSGSATKRSYTGSAGNNKVAIGINGTSVDVSGLWEDGTKVYNWYDGSDATVSGGSVTFNGGSMKTPILVSEKNPADYGVSF